MPKTVVEIEWDKPDDEDWLDTYHIALALRAYCRTTRFVVREIELEDAIDHNSFLPEDEVLVA